MPYRACHKHQKIINKDKPRLASSLLTTLYLSSFSLLSRIVERKKEKRQREKKKDAIEGGGEVGEQKISRKKGHMRTEIGERGKNKKQVREGRASDKGRRGKKKIDPPSLARSVVVCSVVLAVAFSVFSVPQSK